MTPDELFKDLSAPGEGPARRRAWAASAGAFSHRAPVRRRRPAALAATAAAVVAGGLALSPPGSAVADWVGNTVRSVVDPRPEPPPRAAELDELPGGGRLLVLAGRRPWVVGAGAPRKLLGEVGDATFSARALYVAATRRNELVAVDLDGRRRWTVTAQAVVTHPRWSPDGFRVAYFAGERLHVVAGDGLGDRILAVIDPTVAPAWRPGARRVLAYAAAGAMVLRDADTGAELFAVRNVPPHPRLAFSPDGSRLLVAGARQLQIRDGSTGALTQRVRAPKGWLLTGARWMPDGRALVVTRTRGGQGEVVLARLRGRGEEVRRMFAAEKRFDALPSPDGKWILVDWKAAGSWLFLPVAGGRPRSVQNPESRFESGPVRLLSWAAGPG